MFKILDCSDVPDSKDGGELKITFRDYDPRCELFSVTMEEVKSKGGDWPPQVIAAELPDALVDALSRMNIGDALSNRNSPGTVYLSRGDAMFLTNKKIRFLGDCKVPKVQDVLHNPTMYKDLGKLLTFGPNAGLELSCRPGVHFFLAPRGADRSVGRIEFTPRLVKTFIPNVPDGWKKFEEQK